MYQKYDSVSNFISKTKINMKGVWSVLLKLHINKSVNKTNQVKNSTNV